MANRIHVLERMTRLVPAHAPITRRKGWSSLANQRRWAVSTLFLLSVLFLILSMLEWSLQPSFLAVPEGTRVRTGISTNASVAWLLSWGGSGASDVMLQLLMKEPQAVVATNYYDKVTSMKNGPILLSQESDSNQFTLSNTHCLGYGTVGSASLDFSTSVNEFVHGCLSGESPEGYAPDVPQRAIHLVRNPFDNLVERFFVTMVEAAAVRKQKLTGRRTENSSTTHSAIHTLVRQQDNLIGATQDIPSFSLDPTGFRQYCRYLDETQQFDILFNHNNDYDALPCRSEWYRYALWHAFARQTYMKYQKATANLARSSGNRTQLTRPLPFLVLHYEDIFQMNDTMSSRSPGAIRLTGMTKLLRFLNVTAPAEGTPIAPLSRIATLPASRLPTSEFFLTIKERKLAYQLAREVAGRQTWQLIKRYFPRDQYNDDKDTDMGSVASYHELRQMPPRYPAVSWLMSFPNSVRMSMLRPSSTGHSAATCFLSRH
jgi:hypothetical protein